MEEILNRVSKSPVLTLDLSEFNLEEGVVGIDLADVLFMGQILREKDFNTFLESYDWAALTGKVVAIYCSADAILPQWAFLAVSARAIQFAKSVEHADPQTARVRAIESNIEKLDFQHFAGKVVVIKGCGQDSIPLGAYLKATAKLALVARKILYGEPCSAVPVFKK
jgi:hypothetical protein